MNFHSSVKYALVEKELLEKVEKAVTLEEVCNTFLNFIRIYTATPNLWNIWLKKENENKLGNEKKIQVEKIKSMAKIHFYHFKILDYSSETFEKGDFGRTLKWENGNPLEQYSWKFYLEFLENALIFPHDKLEEMKDFYDERAASPIRPNVLKKYYQALSLYKKVDKAYSSLSSNFEILLVALKETNDDYFIIENIECWLYLTPHNENIWKSYLGYLKIIGDYNWLLSVYSRYCRLFIEDLQMRKEYQNEIAKKGLENDVCKWWIDAIEIEIFFENVASAKKVLDKALKARNSISDDSLLRYSLWFEYTYGSIIAYVYRLVRITIDNPRLRLQFAFTYNIDNRHALSSQFLPLTRKTMVNLSKSQLLNAFKLQKFSLPRVFIYILQKTKNYNILIKLYLTCKYFYFRRSNNLCHRLVCTQMKSNDRNILNPLVSFMDFPHFRGVKKFVITNQMFVVHSDDLFFSIFLQNTFLHVKYLTISYQKLSENELKIVSNFKLKTLQLNKVIVQKNDEEFLKTNELIAYFPTVYSMSIIPTKSNLNFRSLSEIYRTTKLRRFILAGYALHTSPSFVEKFLKNNVDPNAQIVASLIPFMDANAQRNFEEKMKKLFVNFELQFLSNVESMMFYPTN